MTASWFADALAASGFLRRYPQFTAMVAAMEPMATEQVAIMAIGRHWLTEGRVVLRLYVNTTWLADHAEHFAGVLQHEIHHAVCGHLDDETLHAVAEPRWMELAMELAANEYIVEAMPPAHRWQSYSEFGVRGEQTTRERYELLVAAARSGRLRMLDEDELDRLDPNWRRRSPDGNGPRVVVMPKRRSILPWANRPKVLGGGFPDEHRPGQRVAENARGVGDAIDRARDGARAETWADGSWLGAPTDPKRLAIWRQRLLDHLRGDAGGTLGVVGASQRHSKELPRQVAQEPGGTLAWSSILRVAFVVPRAVQPTWLRPSRRFPERLGELPGRLRRAPRRRLLVGLDTSASMDAEAMSLALAEIRRLARHADPTIVEVDAAVHRVHRDLHVEIVTGGGDTDFHPLFALAGSSTADGIVYFTDGVGDWPAQPPSLPVLWVLVGDGPFDCPWGTVVRLPVPVPAGGR